MGALARLGAVQNPIVPIYREREVAFCLNETRAEWLLVARGARPLDEAVMRAGVAAGLSPARVSARPLRPARGRPGRLPPRPPTATTVRWIYYTSGTTSAPKGVAAHRRHPDRRAAAVWPTPSRSRRRHRLDRLPVLAHRRPRLPHDPALPRLRRGARSRRSSSTRPSTVLFARNGVTMVGGGPAFYQMYLAKQRKQPGTRSSPSLRLLSGGGAPMPPRDVLPRSSARWASAAATATA